MRLRGIIAAVCAIALAAFAAAAQTYRERGAYLVNTLAACGNCHTPHDADNQPVPGMELAGGREFDNELGHIIGPNVTPDPDTGIGKWSETQIVYALRTGKRPDGTIIGPPMPIEWYRQLSDRDALSIATYLKSVKPVHHEVARSAYKIRCRPPTARPSTTSPSPTATTSSPTVPISPAPPPIAWNATPRAIRAGSR